jgi:transposase InsO family protein
MKKTRDIVKLRRWCIRRRGAGVPVNMICTSAQIPRRTFYNWWSRYRLGGLEGLEPRSRQPHTVHRIPPENVERILRLRREKGWCPILIEGYLRRVESVEIGHTTIHRLLKQAGLNNPLPKPRRQRSYKRWQRKHPNSLWQCDLKVVDARWLITILDDHSRYVTGSHIFKDGTAENVISLLDQAIHEYTKPREILTDHGSQFWSVRRGESNFDAYCERSKIKHILGGIGKPTTLGKIERWFRTYDLEHARFPLHWKFIEYYNYERPHMSLDYSTPAEVYFDNVPNVMG